MRCLSSPKTKSTTVSEYRNYGMLFSLECNKCSSLIIIFLTISSVENHDVNFEIMNDVRHKKIKILINCLVIFINY